MHPEFNLDKAVDRMNKEKYVVKLKIQSKEKLTTYDEIRGKIKPILKTSNAVAIILRISKKNKLLLIRPTIFYLYLY